MGITTNSMDARSLGQPGGFFNSLTESLNRGIGAWAGARDRQDERQFNQQLLAARVGRENQHRSEQLARAAEERKIATIERARKWASESGDPGDTSGLGDGERTQIEKLAAIKRQDQARKVQEKQAADIRAAAFLADAGFDPAEMGFDLLPGSGQLTERAKQVSGDQQAERYAKGVEGMGKAWAGLRHSLGMSDPNANLVAPITKDLENGVFGTKKTGVWDPVQKVYVPAPVAPGFFNSQTEESPAAAPAAPAPKGVVRRADLTAYSRKHGMDEATAADYLTRNGFAIEGQ